MKWNMKFKESRKKIFAGILAVTLFLCASCASYFATKAIVTSSTYGDRELPIYSVDTQEKKIALSFDAAWGTVR